MSYKIRMGIPEMNDLWNKLQSDYRNGTINKKPDGTNSKKITRRLT